MYVVSCRYWGEVAGQKMKMQDWSPETELETDRFKSCGWEVTVEAIELFRRK